MHCYLWFLVRFVILNLAALVLCCIRIVERIEILLWLSPLKLNFDLIKLLEESCYKGTLLSFKCKELAVHALVTVYLVRNWICHPSYFSIIECHKSFHHYWFDLRFGDSGLHVRLRDVMMISEMLVLCYLLLGLLNALLVLLLSFSLFLDKQLQILLVYSQESHVLIPKLLLLHFVQVLLGSDVSRVKVR